MITSNALAPMVNALKGVKGHSEENIINPESKGTDVLTRDRNELDTNSVAGQRYNLQNLGIAPKNINGQMPSYAPRGL
jgi:hypothetical protein